MFSDDAGGHSWVNSSPPIRVTKSDCYVDIIGGIEVALALDVMVSLSKCSFYREPVCEQTKRFRKLKATSYMNYLAVGKPDRPKSDENC